MVDLEMLIFNFIFRSNFVFLDYGRNKQLKEMNEDLRSKIHQVPEDEFVLCSFAASWHTDIWSQGQLYFTQHYLYFYSSLFGIVKMVIF